MTSSHILTASFKGGLADRGELPSNDLEKSLSGARRLLAHHANFYTTGKIAATGKSDTRFYQITCHPPRQGSFIYDLSVNLLGNAIWEVAKYSFGDFIR